MPIYRRSHENGDLYIEFDIIFPPPQSITPEKVKLLEQALPSRQPVKVNAAEVDEYVLQNVDAGRQAGGSSHAMDEDDHMHSGPQVQCAQQ